MSQCWSYYLFIFHLQAEKFSSSIIMLWIVNIWWILHIKTFIPNRLLSQGKNWFKGLPHICPEIHCRFSLKIETYKFSSTNNFLFFSNSNFLFYTFLQKKKEKEKIFKSRYILSKCQCYKNKQSWQIEYLLSFSNKILTFSETRFQPGVDLSKWKIHNMKRCYQKKFWQP